MIPILDRYLMFYIRTADKLQRTARWIESLPRGIAYLREVVLEDKLGICAALEEQMKELIGTYFCEWTEVLNDPVRKAKFKQFGNTEKMVENIEPTVERGQVRPSDWVTDSATTDFGKQEWKSDMAWQPLIEAGKFVKDAPVGSGQAVLRGDTQLAVFWVPEKGGKKGRYYATQQMCPHKRAFVLSDGLIGDDPGEEGKDRNLWISCPMHKRNFKLGSGATGSGPKEAEAKGQRGKCLNDDTLSIATFDAEEREDGWVYVKLPSVEELDDVLGMEKWRVKEGEKEMEKRERLRKMKGKKVNGEAMLNGSAPNGANGKKEETVMDW